MFKTKKFWSLGHWNFGHCLVIGYWLLIINKIMFLVIGLDPVRERLPRFFLEKTYPFFEFCKTIVGATFNLPILGYKPNSAFFEAAGEKGIKQLKMLCDYIREKRKVQDKKRKANKLMIILDAKRGDIGSTNEGYLKYAFEYLQVDAITLHPYLGAESLGGFLNYSQKNNKLLFVLCKTSNKGAGEFQDLELKSSLKVYEKVALQVKNNWSKKGNCGLVVGATHPEDLKRIRELVGNGLPVLSPGVGAQGGDLKRVLEVGGYFRKAKLFVPVSRSIIYPKLEKESLEEFKAKVKKKAEKFLKLGSY